MTRETASIVIAIVALVALVAIVQLGMVPVSGTAPQQPIAFYHYLHARDKQIACEYCHRTVRTASYAGMPATQFCMRCHRDIIPQFSEIRKLHGYWDRQQAVPWARVYRLPGFVNFSHQAHVVIGNVPCETCHGQVKEMAALRPMTPMNMGWCLGCHRGQINYPGRRVKKAPTNCWTCHR